MKHGLKAIILVISLAIPVLASRAYAMDMALPPACGKPGQSMSMDQPMDMPGIAMKDFQKDFMNGMQQMDPAMMQGMMQDNADVAFVCGMIAHHMGAVQMAQVELKYGKDKWARQLAQKIIDAQTKEIADMTAWLKKRPK